MTKTPLNKDKIYNVMEWGAKGDGTTNDTTAIQAAIDAAAVAGNPEGHVVYFPANTAADATYQFSNLKLPAYARLHGAGMEATILRRIIGSTGPAIRDKTSAEGNTGGATGIQLQDFTLNGNDTTGDGIDLGRTDRSPNPSAVDFNNNGYLEHIKVHSFAGSGIIMQSNGLAHQSLEVNLCTTGLYLWNGGGNAFYSTICQLNTSYDYRIGSATNVFNELHCETTLSQPILIEGSSNRIFGAFILLGANATDIIYIATAAALCQIHGLHIDAAGHTYTNEVSWQKSGWVTGNAHSDWASVIDTDAHRGGMWIHDGNAGGSGFIIHGDDVYAAADDTASLGLTHRFALVSGKTLRTEHVAAATPTGGASGDIKVGNGKIWAKDGATWKSVTIA